MAESVVSFAVERLGDLLNQEGKFLFGVSDQINDIQDELRRMRYLLKDADARQEGDEIVRTWVVEISDIAYRIDNVLEIYALKVASMEGKRGIKKFMRRFPCIFDEGVLSFHKIGSEIDTINTDIKNITTSLETYGIKAISQEESSSASDKQRWPRISYSELIEQDFVGMEDDVEQLVSIVVGSDKECNIVSITGMGGQGKTAVATKIYNRADVRSNFKGFASTYGTQQCEPKKIFQDILRELVPEIKDEVNTMGDRELVQKLHKVQQEIRCLVVLDDIWSINDWESLKSAFPIGGAAGSKIILTTRKYEVAKVGYVHELRFLDENEGWELLQKKAFPKRDATLGHGEWSGEMEELGRAMTRHCYGLPVAIVSLGVFLRNKKQDLHCWKMVLEEMERSGFRRKITGVQESLAISYYDLPYELKSCFRYLGSLPNGYEIDVEKLFQLWMAESMIYTEQCKEKETMIEVAERYLKEFKERCMVQVQVDESTGRVKSCRLHQHFRELCLRMEIEEGFIRVIDLQSGILDDSSSWGTSFSTKVRRLSIYLGNLEDLDNFVPPRRRVARHLSKVSFFLQNYFSRSKISHIVESHLSDFKLVRILDLGGLIFSKLEKAIGKLIYLKYLGLRYTVFHELPSTIGNLLNLQTLDLWDDNTQYAGIFVPNVLGKLKRLKYLYLRSPMRSNELKMQLYKLSQLEILENFDSEAFEVEDLFKLTNLRKFGAKISKKSDLKTITKYLRSTSSYQLKHFTLSIKYCDLYSEEGLDLLTEVFVCHRLDEFSLNGRTGMLPEYNKNFSSSLAKLTLESCELRDDPMPTLEKLPNLRSLYLKWNAFIGKEIVCSQTGFPQLRILKFWRIRRLTNWSVEKGAMGKLSSLDIGSCPDLKMLPDGLQFVTTLQQLVIRWMPQAFTNRLRVLEDGNDGEDFYKVAHVLPIKIIHYDGKEEVVSSSSSSSNIVPKKMDPIAKKTTKAERMVKQHATPEVGVVIREPTFPSSSTTTRSNTKQEYVLNGKAPITEAYSESSDDDERGL